MHFGLTNGMKPHCKRRKICLLRGWRFASLARPDTWSFGRRGHAPSRIATPLPPKALSSGRKACRIPEHLSVSVRVGVGAGSGGRVRRWHVCLSLSSLPEPGPSGLSESPPGRFHGSPRPRSPSSPPPSPAGRTARGGACSGDGREAGEARAREGVAVAVAGPAGSEFGARDQGRRAAWGPRVWPGLGRGTTAAAGLASSAGSTGRAPCARTEPGQG